MDQLLENAVARALGLRIEPRDDDAKRRRQMAKGKSAKASPARPDRSRLH